MGAEGPHLLLCSLRLIVTPPAAPALNRRRLRSRRLHSAEAALPDGVAPDETLGCRLTDV